VEDPKAFVARARSFIQEARKDLAEAQI